MPLLHPALLRASLFNPWEGQIVLWAPGKKEIFSSAWCNKSFQQGVSKDLAWLLSSGLRAHPKADPGLAWWSSCQFQMDGAGDSKSRDFPLPDNFSKRTEKGCKSQDLDARKEQRWQEIPTQQKIQLVLGQMQRRKCRHKQRQRKDLSRRAAQEVRSV